jgi:hypothetical protein
LSVGTGGPGGGQDDYIDHGIQGTNGNLSKATWNGITITANGGKGGGVIGGVTGGAGGTATINNPASPLIRAYDIISGTGTNGYDGSTTNASKDTYGAPGGRIGTFGGASSGGSNNTGSMDGTLGSGGAGAAWDRGQRTGGKGGAGLIQVDYYYYEQD